MANEVDIRDIGAITGRYYIPSYQRGYRWTAENVTCLLDDLCEFCHSKDGAVQKYCIQPVTFQEYKDGMRIVDGQQRITTISLIRYVFESELPNFSWNLYYEELGTDLKDQLIHLEDDDSINAHFMREVLTAIKNWCKKEKPENVGFVRKLFVPSDAVRTKSVFFINYLTVPKSEKDTGQQTFNELNDGQTPLTSSELVKALFMVSDNGLPDSERFEIANEWSLIEEFLRLDAVWLVWRADDFKSCYTRLDVLIAAIVEAPLKESVSDKLFVFHAVESWLKNHSADGGRTDALKLLWNEIVKCYWWMRSCIDDSYIYNMLGWIAWQKEDQFQSIYKLWRLESSGSFCRFRKTLKKYIRDKFCDKNESILSDISGLRYGSYGLVDVLSFANVLAACGEGAKLPFDVINGDHISNGKKWKWNIEHISPQTPTSFTDARKSAWLSNASAELSDEERDAFLLLSDDERWNYVWTRYRKVEDLDVIGNLTLLDSATNESYGNDIFPFKRRKIFEVREEFQKNKRPILPCTVKAFSKSLTNKGVTQLRYWGSDDVASFQEYMQGLFTDFLEDCK